MTLTAQELIRIIREMTPAEKTQLGQALSDIGVSVVITKRLGTATILPVRNDSPMATQEKSDKKDE